METFFDRLLVEKEELDIKIEKLNSFVVSENFKTIDEANQCLLKTQLSIMQAYSTILDMRIKHIKGGE